MSQGSDPYGLDDLASQLIERELKSPPANSLDVPDLPDYLPLNRSNPFLKADVFNVEEFLLSRSHTSLQDLRAELRDFLSTLKEELVKLINDDYEKFISLSTDLRGEGDRLLKIKSPLSMLQTEIKKSKDELSVIQDAIEDKLRKRAILRDEKALLHLLLKISDSVTRLESLLLIVNKNEQDDNETSDMPSTLKLASNTEDQAEDIARGNRAKHLSRVAAEYTQLLYHVSKAKAENCAFVDEIQWRVDRIQSTLSSDLDHLFGLTLTALIEGKPSDGKVLDLEKPKLTADLSECLRTYDLLGLWRDAEDVLRRDVVRRFIKKTVFPGALAAPHSPLVPHTPFHSSSHSATFTSSHSGLPPTPYTPYTSFALRPTPFHSSYGSIGKPNPPPTDLLDESDDPLANLYSQILRFVERDLTRIMELAEKVSLKSFPSIRLDKGDGSTPQTAVPMQSVARGDGQRFDIMANVVWDEFGRAIMNELGNVVFSAGRPNEFRKNHELTQAFIRALEFYAPSRQAIESMRSHSTYISFEKRWQLPVYFQLRWKEVVTLLEDSLATSRIESSVNTVEENQFVTSQAVAVWTAISACWSAEIFIPELSHRFWRLTLQIVSRYKTWLDQVLKSTLKASVADQTSNVPSRSSTPMPGGDNTNDSAPSDDTVLRQNVAAMVDIRSMRSSLMILWQEEISKMLPRDTDPETDDVSPEDALQDALTNLGSLTEPLSGQIVSILSRRCCDAATPVRSIPSTIRAKANKKTPTEPSSFISSILRPLKVFFGIGATGVGTVLKDDFLDSYANQVFDSVCQRYVSLAVGLRKSEDSLRRLTKAKRTGFSLFGTAGKEGEGRDEDNIKMQMILDVEAFGKDAQSLGVDVSKHDTYRALHETVHSLLDPLDAS